MAQIETRTQDAMGMDPRGGYRGAFVCIGNLAQMRQALGQEAAQELLNEAGAALGGRAGQPAEQVVYAGDDCFLAWLPEGGDQELEELLVRISTRPVCVRGRRLVLLAQAGWTELRTAQPRELLVEEVGYVLFAAATHSRAPQPASQGERFFSDMEIAAQVIEALGSDRIDCQWQGISGLYADAGCLYWRGVAQPDTPELGLSFVQAQGFMPSLERLHLTRALDRHMALRVLGQLISMPALRLACRISPLSVQHDPYWHHLLSTLAAHPGAARRFTLEISGQVPLPSREAARAFCGAVRDRGAHIALANFGCGPANLADLQACQPRTLLLDESFVLRCRGDADEKVALRDMVRMCAPLAEQVVVTGVHDEEAHSDAMRAGARWISGSYLHPTAPFASKFWRSRTASLRGSGTPCAQRGPGPGPATGRPRAQDSGWADWRSAAVEEPRRCVQ